MEQLYVTKQNPQAAQITLIGIHQVVPVKVSVVSVDGMHPNRQDIHVVPALREDIVVTINVL